MRRSASAERRFLVPGKQDPPLRILHLAIQGNSGSSGCTSGIFFWGIFLEYFF
jgi:hypothetical protein